MGAELARRALGKAAQHGDDLSLHVQPGIVVEPARRLIQAEADENDLAPQILGRLVGARPDKNVAAVDESLPAADEVVRSIAAPAPLKGHLLIPTSVRCPDRES